MKFLKATNGKHGKPVWVNMGLVQCFGEGAEGGTLIEYGPDDTLLLRESPEDVAFTLMNPEQRRKEGRRS